MEKQYNDGFAAYSNDLPFNLNADKAWQNGWLDAEAAYFDCQYEYDGYEEDMDYGE